MKERVILVATVERAPACLKALRALGFETSFFEFRKGLVYKNQFVRSLIRRLPALRFIKQNTVANINKYLLEEVERFKPHYLIATVAENIQPETILKIRSRGVITANWFTDLFTHWRIIERVAPAYTLFFSSDSGILEKLKELNFNNCFYLPEAVDDSSIVPLSGQRKNLYDLAFIGSYNPKMWPDREKFLSAVKNFGLNIWGPEDWRKSSLKEYYRGTSRGEDMSNIYRKSKIAFEIPWDDGQSQGIGTRPFEVMLGGACLLIYDIRKDMPKTFFSNKEYIPFRNEDELKSRVKHYLTHEAEREAIARAGYQVIISKHTFKDRIKNIIDTTENFLSRKV